MDRLLSTRQVAEVLGVRPKRVRGYINEGKLQGTKLGGNGKSRRHWRVSENALQSFIKGVESVHRVLEDKKKELDVVTGSAFLL